jgi:hypothetical protein
MQKKLIIIPAIILLLSGCSAAYREAFGQPDPEADHAKCLSFGARPGTDAYIQCRMNSEQLRLQTQRNMLAANAQLGASSRDLMILGAPRHQPVTTCQMIGGLARCQTF